MSTYEFTTNENQTIDELRRILRHLSILFALQGLVQLPFFFLRADVLSTARGAIALVSVALFLLLAFSYFRPLDNLKRIVTTEGSDIKEMMQALADLRVAFTMAAIIFTFMIIVSNVDLVVFLLQ